MQYDKIRVGIVCFGCIVLAVGAIVGALGLITGKVLAGILVLWLLCVLVGNGLPEK